MAKPSKIAPPRPAEDKKSSSARPSVPEAVRVPARSVSLKKSKSASEPELEVEQTPLEAAAKPHRRASRTPPSEIHPTLAYLGATVKKVRKARGMTQMQVAKICGFNSAAIFMVEAGRQNMTIKSLMAVASALGLEVGDLFPRTTPRTAAKLTEVVDVIGDVKDRVAAQLRLLDRIAQELRDEAGIID